MNKKLLFWSLALFSLVLTGCTKTADDSKTDQPKDEVKEEVADEKEAEDVEDNDEEEATDETVETGDMKSYSSEVYGVEIDYPSDWEVQEGILGSVAAFLSPRDGANDLFQENVNIVVQDMAAQPMDLDDYTELSLTQIKTFFNDVKVTTDEAATLSGEDAHQVVYTGTQGQLSLKWMQIWAVVDEKAYVFTYTASEDTYDDFIDKAEAMAESFEIK